MTIWSPAALHYVSKTKTTTVSILLWLGACGVAEPGDELGSSSGDDQEGGSGSPEALSSQTPATQAGVGASFLPAFVEACARGDQGGCCSGRTVLAGTELDDTLSPSPTQVAVPLCIAARAGVDEVQTGRAGDVVLAGDGDDEVGGGRSADLIFGAAGDDVLRGAGGADQLVGGEGADTLDGGPGDDTLIGGPGHDHIVGGPGRDRILLGGGSDVVVAGADDDVVEFLSACAIDPGDVIDGGPGYDVLHSPVGEKDLVDMGVTLDSIERVVLTKPAIGACVEFGDLVECDCCDAAGAQPETRCVECEPGLVRSSSESWTEDGRQTIAVRDQYCIPERSCTAQQCGAHGSCVGGPGASGCVCDPGYAGLDCSACAPGFALVAGDCEASDECRAERCGGRGDCAYDDDYELGCVCDPGHGGESCGGPTLSLSFVGPARPGIPMNLTVSGAECDEPFRWHVDRGVLVGSGNTVRWTADALDKNDRLDIATAQVTCPTDPSLWVKGPIAVGEKNGPPSLGIPHSTMEPIDEAILELMDDNGIPGAVVAVGYDGDGDNRSQLIYLRSFGYRDSSKTEAMRTCTPMRIASGTKPFTRAAIDRLEAVGFPLPSGNTFDSNALSLNLVAEFGDLLSQDWSGPVPTTTYSLPPEEVEYSSQYGCAQQEGIVDWRYSLLTLADVVLMRSGMLTNRPSQQPSLPDPMADPVGVANLLGLLAEPQPADYIGLAGAACLIFQPGTVPPGKTGYSNVGYHLLQQIIEQVAGRSMMEVVEDNVFGAAGTDSTLTSDYLTGRPYATMGTDGPVPGESYYFSDAPNRPNNNNMTMTGGVWSAGAPVPPPYALRLSDHGGAGDMIANARALTDLLGSYNVSTGAKLRVCDLDDTGTTPCTTTPQPSGGWGAQFGRLPGTGSLMWQLPFSVDENDPAYFNTCDPSDGPFGLGASIPPGFQVAVIFNKDIGDDECNGLEKITVALADAFGQLSFDPSTYPLPLTDAQIADSCQLCGNFELDAGEVCDGWFLGDASCEYGGAPTCSADCSGLDYSTCTNCTDGVIQASEGEECEQNDLDDRSCSSFGFDGGNLHCGWNCRFDTSGCESGPPPGCIDGTEGCGCLAVNDNHLDWEDGHPDGATRSDRYCPDDGETVYVAAEKSLYPDGECVLCTDENKVAGCPCEHDGGGQDPCGAGLSCQGWDTGASLSTGRCWDTEDRAPSFQCLANCEALLGPQATCYHEHEAEARCIDDCQYHQASNCWTTLSVPATCHDGGQCFTECSEDADCADLGYPADYSCGTLGACVRF